MKLENFFVGITLAVLAFTLLVTMIAQSSTTYKVTNYDNSSFTKVINQTIALDEKQKEITEKLVPKETSDVTSWDAMIRGGYLALTSILGSIGILGTFFTAIQLELNIPPAITNWIIGVCAIILVIIVVYIVMRVGNRGG